MHFAKIISLWKFPIRQLLGKCTWAKPPKVTNWPSLQEIVTQVATQLSNLILSCSSSCKSSCKGKVSISKTKCITTASDNTAVHQRLTTNDVLSIHRTIQTYCYRSILFTSEHWIEPLHHKTRGNST